MKSTFVLGAALCVALASFFSSAATNVLADPEFETVEAGLRGWRATDGTTKYTVVTDDSRDRGTCVEAVESAVGGSLGRLVQDLGERVVAGQTYRLTGWIKTKGVTSAGGVVIGVGAVDLRGALPPGASGIEIGRVKGTTDWTFFDSGEFVLPTRSPGTVGHAVYLDFNGAGGGTARFDDISLVGPAAARLETFWTWISSIDVRVLAMVVVAVLTLLAGTAAVWTFYRLERSDRA